MNSKKLRTLFLAVLVLSHGCRENGNNQKDKREGPSFAGKSLDEMEKGLKDPDPHARIMPPKH